MNHKCIQKTRIDHRHLAHSLFSTVHFLKRLTFRFDRHFRSCAYFCSSFFSCLFSPPPYFSRVPICSVDPVVSDVSKHTLRRRGSWSQPLPKKSDVIGDYVKAILRSWVTRLTLWNATLFSCFFFSFAFFWESSFNFILIFSKYPSILNDHLIIQGLI